MPADLRSFLDDLRAAGEIIEIHKPVDIRHIAALVDKSPKALLFHKVIGYGMPVISGLTNSRRRIAISMKCDYSETEGKLRHALDHPIPPVRIEGGAEREVFVEGDEVDLFNLPVPVCSVFDGGPMITAGVTLAVDPEFGLNAGTYRYQVKERNLTGIDIVTPNNLRRYAERALAENRPLPISINIGIHPVEMIASLYKAPIGMDEMGIAGGIRGEAVRLAPCETVDVPCIADSEIVLEAEILPTGWTKPEGRFGEFTRLMGGLHWNPYVRVKAISRRKDAIYYALHMPWENIWLKEHGFQAMLRRALKEAGVQARAINVTPGGCCHWHAVIAIKGQPGDGKNAIIAALSVGDMKHVVIVDDDIDVFDPMDVEWAIATRVQADRDLVVISNARSKPLDPSLPPTPGWIPTTAKCGIDATIPVDVPRERYHRITYAYASQVKLEDYTNGAEAPTAAAPPSGEKTKTEIEALAGRIRATLEKEPLYFAQVAEHFAAEGFPAVTRAMGDLHARGEIWQDAEGKHCIAGSQFAAAPPLGKKR
ncbi:MAG: carboxylyase [Candidatus Tectomicrobia bacterium RIFCSPLOWO2_02_FULL_70_19]|nr:MAG: carboxylyase [Candidatus Tectomicrobia bacterium RIFCSPLOWO2_02_FULL_70_19]